MDQVDVDKEQMERFDRAIDSMVHASITSKSSFPRDGKREDAILLFGYCVASLGEEDATELMNTAHLLVGTPAFEAAMRKVVDNINARRAIVEKDKPPF